MYSHWVEGGDGLRVGTLTTVSYCMYTSISALRHLENPGSQWDGAMQRKAYWESGGEQLATSNLDADRRPSIKRPLSP